MSWDELYLGLRYGLHWVDARQGDVLTRHGETLVLVAGRHLGARPALTGRAAVRRSDMQHAEVEGLGSLLHGRRFTTVEERAARSRFPLRNGAL